MPDGLWRKVWEEDLRAPSRDLINQLFYLLITAFLDGASHLALDRSLIAPWLRKGIYDAFDGLTLLALVQLVLPMGVRMIRSTWRSVKKK